MPELGLLLRFGLAVGAIAVVLIGLQRVLRAVAAAQAGMGNGRRTIEVLESRALTQNAALHVVRIGSRTYAIGSGSVELLADLGDP